jgi:hypothetical protein
MSRRSGCWAAQGGPHPTRKGTNMLKRRYLAVATALAAMAAGLLVAFAASPAGAATPELNWRHFVGLGSSRCLDEDTNYNVKIQLWSCDSGSDESWGLQYGGHVYGGGGQVDEYLIVNRRTGLCLSSYNGSYNSGQAIVLGSCNALTRWWYFPDSNPVGRIVNLYAGKCLDARNNATGNGTVVQQYDCNGTSAQLWRDVDVL